MPQRDLIPTIADLPETSLTLAILGAGGDLTERLLLPALGRLVDRSPALDVTLRGAARHPLTQQEWQRLIRTALDRAGVSEATADRLAETADFLEVDGTDADQLRTLLDSCPTDPVLYLALPPAVGESVAAALGEIDPLPEGLRFAIEKPFGDDLAECRAQTETLDRVLADERLWRVDHFLGNAAIGELLRARSESNPLAGTWDARSISTIEVIFDEVLGLEGRADFYDVTGALRDMLQSHLLLLAAHAVMRLPEELTTTAVHDALAEVLAVTRPWRDDPLLARRARYTEGRVGGQQLPSYVDSDGVDPARETETLAQILLQVDDGDWQGVPILLRSGKAIGEPRAVIVLHLTEVAELSPEIAIEVPGTIEFSLTDGSVRVTAAPDDTGTTADPVTVRPAQDPADIDPYSRVLAGIVSDDHLLSVRGDAAELCWRIVTPILNAWDERDVPLDSYPAGSPGPASWGLPDHESPAEDDVDEDGGTGSAPLT